MRRPEDENPNDSDVSEEEAIDHLLDLTQLEPIAATFAPTSPNTNDQTIALLYPNTNNEPLFANIPPDVILIILRLLSSQDLHHISWMNRTGHWLANRIRIERYRSILANSLLWRYLPAMAQDHPEAAGVHFIEYYIQGAYVTVPPERHHLYQSLSSFWATLVGSRRFPKNWNGTLINDWTELQTMARAIISNLPSDCRQLPANFHLFMNLCSPEYSQEQELALCQRYHALDSLMSTMMLFLRMGPIRKYNQEHQDQPLDLIAELINPQHSRWLTGFGLIALECYLPGIFEELVREALGIFGRNRERESETDKLKAERRLSGIECLLGRLSEADLLTYISRQNDPPRDPNHAHLLEQLANFDQTFIDSKRRLFMDVIGARYEFLMRKLSETVLFRIERSNRSCFSLRELRILPQIIDSPLLLRQFSNEGLVKLLSLVRGKETNVLISNHPCLYPFLTFEVLERWVGLENDRRTAKAILTQEELLATLNHHQIVCIAQYLGSDCFAETLNNPVFLETLKRDPAGNRLLMQLALLPDLFFDVAIARNPYIASLLTHDDIMTLFNTEDGNTTAELLKHDSVLKKLSSSELLEAVIIHPAEFFDIAKNQLKWFSDDDLIKLARRGFSYPDTAPQFNIILEAFPTELERRTTSLTSSHWLELGCMHPNLALIIPDKHIERFVYADLGRLITAHSENRLVRQKMSAIREELCKKTEREETEVERISQERWQRERQQQLTRIMVKQPEPTVQMSPAIPLMTFSISKNRWGRKILEGLLIIVGLIGIGLIILGIASGIGVPIAVTITGALLSFLPWSAALTSILVGFFMHIFSGLCLAVISKNTEELQLPSIKPTGSTLGFFELFGVSPEAPLSKDNQEEPSLPKTVVAQPIVRQDIRASGGFSPAKASTEKVSESTQFKL